MPRKQNSESEAVASSGAAASRRKATVPTSRPRRSAALANTLVPAEATEAEIVTTLSVPSEPTLSEPTHEEIAVLAYSYWIGRGRQGGSPDDDWLRAERELRQQIVSAAQA